MRRPGASSTREVEVDWYKDAVVYETHVRAFADSDGDGRGDFAGLTRRLDYLSQLGVTAIWLLPFYPSPLRDDGYDIADYTGIHPDFGTLADFRTFIEEAHRRSIKVITELVLNHTSDQHPWFQRARRAPPGSSWRNFYVWSESPARYEQARVIFSDFESSNWAWDQVAGAYYWHRFYSHQPDLNFDHPPVRQQMLRVVDFWLGLGVDGLRLDAVPYLYEREGTDCENLPETHAFLAELRRHVDDRFSGRMLLAEANQWPEDASAYFGKGDECQMAFHFPLMPRLFMGLRMEDRFPIVDIMGQTPEIPPSCQWAMFLRNHDELTLEMVTDEERDYMYRAYANDPAMRVNLGIRRRLAPLLGFHRQKIELMFFLLMSLPGTPVIYYGDEIGMGDNVFLGDRNGVRTPMQWNADRNAGFSSANPHRLYLPVNIDAECHYEAVNVAAQLENPDSLLRWVRRLVAMRRRHRVFGRGRIDFLQSDNPRVLSFVRRDDDEQILVVVNLSRFSQYVELDLAAFRGMTPLELFGQTPFPPIGDLPYLVTLAPYAFHWLQLCAPNAPSGAEHTRPVLRAPAPWWRLFDAERNHALEAALPGILMQRRWFSGKDRRIHGATIAARATLSYELGSRRAELLAVSVEYVEGDAERYFLPVTRLEGEAAEAADRDHPEMVLATLQGTGGHGLLVDAHADPSFVRALLGIATGRRRKGDPLVGSVTAGGRRILSDLGSDDLVPVRVLSGEQSNTSVVIGTADTGRVILKSFRRLQSGSQPELEIGRLLAQSPAAVAHLLGAVELEHDEDRLTIAVVHEFVPHESDAWVVATRLVEEFLEHYRVWPEDHGQPAAPDGGVCGALASGARVEDAPVSVDAEPGGALGAAELLGRRTAELHAAIAASGASDPAFAPEPETSRSQRSTYQSMRTAARRTLVQLRQRVRNLPEDSAELARLVLAREDDLLDAIQPILDVRGGVRIRAHGDLHLGQVLATGRDYVFVDFEGEPAKSFSERRLKRSPLVDIAGMLRSYDYAALVGVDDLWSRGSLGERDLEQARLAARAWSDWCGVAFLAGYMPTAEETGLTGDLDRADFARALRAHLVDKACYEVRYELANRPGWVHLPLLGLHSLLGWRSRVTG